MSGVYSCLQLCYYSFSKATLICFAIALACWRSACFGIRTHFGTVPLQDMKSNKFKSDNKLWKANLKHIFQSCLQMFTVVATFCWMTKWKKNSHTEPRGKPINANKSDVMLRKWFRRAKLPIIIFYSSSRNWVI